MDCKEVEQQIVSGRELTHEAQSHLLHCRECQDFSMLCHLVEKREGAPSAESDAKCDRGWVDADWIRVTK